MAMESATKLSKIEQAKAEFCGLDLAPRLAELAADGWQSLDEATLAIDPTADNTVESDGTVALTLVAGTGYTVGTSTPVMGTITNDDSTVTLIVSPAAAIEDGTANLIYTFTRTGFTTNALTVNYTVAGTATLGTDYTGISSIDSTKIVSFAAGASTTVVTVDPTADATADATVEPNETVTLTLAAGVGYTVGTTAAVTGTIVNDDVSSSTTYTLTSTQSSLQLLGGKRISEIWKQFQ